MNILGNSFFFFYVLFISILLYFVIIVILPRNSDPFGPWHTPTAAWATNVTADGSYLLPRYLT